MIIRHSILYLLILTAFPAFAQITITSADLPVTGNPYYLDVGGLDSVIDLNITGPNQIWDYSLLSVTSVDTLEYTSVSSTPLLYQFYFNNIILYSNWKADLALPGPDLNAIPGSPISVTDVINYYKITPSAFFQVGFGATINSVQTSQRYDPRDKLLSLPNTFGLIDSNDFDWLFVIPALGAYGQSKTRINETDGWGTLILPNASYNTLRVKSTITGVDTFHVDQLNYGLAIPSTQYEYRWYANGLGEPVLTVNATEIAGNITITSTRFKHDVPAGIILQNDLNERITAGPNPVNEELNIHCHSLTGQYITIGIYDISGKCITLTETQIGTGSSQTFKYPVSEISSGYYTLRIQTDESVFTRKLVIY